MIEGEENILVTKVTSEQVTDKDNVMVEVKNNAEDEVTGGLDEQILGDAEG